MRRWSSSGSPKRPPNPPSSMRSRVADGPTLPSMSATVEGAGVALASEGRGAGRGIVLVHGMASPAAALLHLAEPLEAEARVVAYDRRGYGGSGAPEPYERTTVNEQAEDLA